MKTLNDSGRVLGNCSHGSTPEWCVECLRSEVSRLRIGATQSPYLALISLREHCATIVEQDIPKMREESARLKKIALGENFFQDRMVAELKKLANEIRAIDVAEKR